MSRGKSKTTTFVNRPRVVKLCFQARQACILVCCPSAVTVSVPNFLKGLQLFFARELSHLSKVDGSFLVELRESDFVESIGMGHKLHLKKLLLARQKLIPLSVAEHSMASAVRREELATQQREGIPNIDTAFSQVLYSSALMIGLWAPFTVRVKRLKRMQLVA